MPRPAKPAFSPEHIAEFNRIQELRRTMMRGMGDAMELWRHCGDPRCRRPRRCQSPTGDCARIALQAIPAEEKRLLRHALEHRIAGLSADEAWAKAEARVAAEQALPEI